MAEDLKNNKPHTVPQRMCIVCREHKDKSLLCRLVKTSNGEIILDNSYKKEGRGAYICKSNACITKCCKHKLLNKHLNTEVKQSIYDTLSLIIDTTKE